jgi:hypothetical protein
LRKEKTEEEALPCAHEWRKKRETLYVSRTRCIADVLECIKCQKIRISNVIRHPWAATLQPTIGVFAGIFDTKGRILLVKIETGSLTGEWDLPGGGVDAEKAKEALTERFLLGELEREIEEETGISLRLRIEASPILWPALLKGGDDMALPIMVGVVKSKPTKGTTQFVSFGALQRLAEGPRGNRLLGGSGGRMHRLVLRLLSRSPNRWYRQRARETLKSIYEKGF